MRECECEVQSEDVGVGSEEKPQPTISHYLGMISNNGGCFPNRKWISWEIWTRVVYTYHAPAEVPAIRSICSFVIGVDGLFQVGKNIMCVCASKPSQKILRLEVLTLIPYPQHPNPIPTTP